MKQIPKAIADRITWSKTRGEHQDLPRIERIEPIAEPCSDCDRIVNGRRKKYRFYSEPQPHWRECCANCGNYRHPQTGEFSVPNNQTAQLYRYFLSKPDK